MSDDDIYPYGYTCLVKDVSITNGYGTGVLIKKGPEAFTDGRRFKSDNIIDIGSHVFFDSRFIIMYVKGCGTILINDDCLVKDGRGTQNE